SQGTTTRNRVQWREAGPGSEPMMVKGSVKLSLKCVPRLASSLLAMDDLVRAVRVELTGIIGLVLVLTRPRLPLSQLEGGNTWGLRSFYAKEALLSSSCL
ncbi:hypothetical protein J6590_098997, partial [Homalodisca vitripennis]